ncbi:hypothetical protein ONE63_008284 [Megalurothrips usitatus]|uniref:Uncharacterized protein n=1 Tax=Megalurothrips usitatus TaxID=439358 RepID=A0AAV7XPS3_9NEOP|nr:hypothetical protein ONE63_008284 [Megalurothrips usitatus]
MKKVHIAPIFPYHFLPFCRRLSFEMLPLRAGPVLGLETGGAICTPFKLYKRKQWTAPLKVNSKHINNNLSIIYFTSLYLWKESNFMVFVF